MYSDKNELIWNDIKRWLRNVVLFTTPSLIIFLTALSNGVDVRIAALSLYGSLINALIDLLIKFKSSNTY